MAWFHNGRKYWYHNGKRYSRRCYKKSNSSGGGLFSGIINKEKRKYDYTYNFNQKDYKAEEKLINIQKRMLEDPYYDPEMESDYELFGKDLFNELYSEEDYNN